MKYTVVFCAVAAACASTSAIAAPKITGTVRAELIADKKDTLEKNLSTGAVLKDETTDRPEFYGSSRLKFSGSEKLSDTLTASYSIEYDFYLDSDRTTDDNTNLRSRSTYASLDHKQYGRIRLGRMTNPEDDLDISLANGNAWGTALPFTGFGGRSNNTIQYYSPYFGADKATRVKLHYAMDENNDTDRSIVTYQAGKRENKKRDVATAQILHKGDTLGWGLSYTQAGNDMNALTAMAQYNAKHWGVGLVARQADYNTDDNEVGAFAVAYYVLPNGMQVYGQGGYADNWRGQKDTSSTIGAFGVSKEIKTASGRATAFVELSGEKYDNTRTNSKGDRINLKDDTIGIGTGLVYKF